MVILGYLKKQPRWQIKVNESGEIQTGVNYGHKHAELIDVPIFEAKIRYSCVIKSSGTVRIKFEAMNDNTEAGLINELKGIRPTSYTCTVSKCMEIMQGLATGKFELLKDGWFRGVFTFSKQGTALSITPFTGYLADEAILPHIK